MLSWPRQEAVKTHTRRWCRHLVLAAVHQGLCARELGLQRLEVQRQAPDRLEVLVDVLEEGTVSISLQLQQGSQ